MYSTGQQEAQKRPPAFKKARNQLIVKPNGLAGRAPPKGYNLQEEMGLTDNKTKYTSIAVSKSIY